MSKKKNSFSLFLDDYVDKQRRLGRSISKRAACEECGTLWNSMSEKEKKIYLDKASELKNNQDSVKKLANQQWEDPFSSGAEIRERVMFKNEITYLSTQIRNEQDLRTHKFYTIHCNYYCRTEDGVYVPAEIALVEFNLEEGITQTYHALIDPGNVPLGYGYEARKVIAEVHGLPFPPHDEGGKTPDRVLNDLLKIIKSSKEKEEAYPPLFTIENNVEASSEILKALSQNGRQYHHLNAHPVHKMFFWLKNKCTEYCGNEPGFPVMANALSEIERDVFRYCPGISCKFHSDLSEKFHNCSLSIAQRLVYVICDHCCRHLKIKLVRGKHIHQNFVKSKSDGVTLDFRCDSSDVTSNPEESDFCGASTYASSTVDDYRYDFGRRIVDEEECSDIKDSYDKDFDADEIVMKIRGRGRALQADERKVGLPRS